MARQVQSLGLTQIELCGVHANFHDQPSWMGVVETYKTAGVTIVSLGVETLVGDKSERDIFQCAASAGARHISVHFKVDSFRPAIEQARRLSDEFGVRVGIHCHGGYMFGGQPDVLDYLISLGSPQIGLCIDTAWCMQIGPERGKPVEWVETYAGHIYGVHFKDFIFSQNGQWKDTVIGQGNLNLPAFIHALNRTGFDGVAILEYEGDPESPLPALHECVRAIAETPAA